MAEQKASEEVVRIRSRLMELAAERALLETRLTLRSTMDTGSITTL
jgi:hypothetical protein